MDDITLSMMRSCGNMFFFLVFINDVMITRRIEDKLEELKSYFNTKFNEQEESLTKTFNNIVADLKKRSLKKYNSFEAM